MNVYICAYIYICVYIYVYSNLSPLHLRGISHCSLPPMGRRILGPFEAGLQGFRAGLLDFRTGLPSFRAGLRGLETGLRKRR